MTQRATTRRSGDVTPDTLVRDVMHDNPIVVEAGTRVVDAARTMQTRDVGDVLVRSEDGQLGILTDRDIVVRVVANERDWAATTAGEVCSRPLETLSPEDTVAHAVNIMRERAVRRLPVLEDGSPVGIVTLGDLAMERELDSLLGQISAASPNL